jgi:hypothetical protein
MCISNFFLSFLNRCRGNYFGVVVERGGGEYNEEGVTLTAHKQALGGKHV